MIYFDKKEAAEFSRSCGNYFGILRNLSNWMNAVGKIVSLDKTGKPIEDRQELKFMDYWETDPEYKKENISIFLVINF